MAKAAKKQATKKLRRQRFPVTMYLYRDGEGAVDECLIADEKYQDIAEAGRSIPVGIYQLVGESKVTANAILED